MILIPAYHTIRHQVPPDAELRKTEGELIFRHVPKEGSLTGIKTVDGEFLFTCKDYYSGKNYCLADNKLEPVIQGKQATVLWYRQPAYLWMDRNRLVELRVGNDTIVSRAQTERWINVSKRVMWWEAVIGFVLFVALDVYAARYFKRRGKT